MLTRVKRSARSRRRQDSGVELARCRKRCMPMQILFKLTESKAQTPLLRFVLSQADNKSYNKSRNILSCGLVVAFDSLKICRACSPSCDMLQNEQIDSRSK